MVKDLTYYQLLPYEREWQMRPDGAETYYIVRLKDIPAVAGDGATPGEAVEDLRLAFDEVRHRLARGRQVDPSARSRVHSPCRRRAATGQGMAGVGAVTGTGG